MHSPDMIDVASESENENVSRDPVAFELGRAFGKRLALQTSGEASHDNNTLPSSSRNLIDKKMDWTCTRCFGCSMPPEDLRLQVRKILDELALRSCS